MTPQPNPLQPPVLPDRLKKRATPTSPSGQRAAGDQSPLVAGQILRNSPLRTRGRPFELVSVRSADPFVIALCRAPEGSTLVKIVRHGHRLQASVPGYQCVVPFLRHLPAPALRLSSQ